MDFELDHDEARLLHTYLGREIDRLIAELSRTEQREFRRALAADVDQLRAIHARLGKRLWVEVPADSAVAGH